MAWGTEGKVTCEVSKIFLWTLYPILVDDTLTHLDSTIVCLWNAPSTTADVIHKWTRGGAGIEGRREGRAIKIESCLPLSMVRKTDTMDVIN